MKEKKSEEEEEKMEEDLILRFVPEQKSIFFILDSTPNLFPETKILPNAILFQTALGNKKIKLVTVGWLPNSTLYSSVLFPLSLL